MFMYVQEAPWQASECLNALYFNIYIPCAAVVKY